MSPVDAEFSKQHRVRKPNDYKSLFKRGRRLRDPLLTLVFHPDFGSLSRLGLAISGKAVASSVQRNRIKRQIREYFRKHHQDLPGCDLVFTAQAAAADANTRELRQSIEALWQQMLQRCKR